MIEGPALLALGKKFLALQSFSVLLGAEFVSAEPGKVVLRIPIRRDLLQQNGFVHGGVLSYAADNAMTFAGGSVLGAAVVTAEYKINYARPAVGHALRAEARVITSSKRQAVCSCEIFAEGDGEAKMCAVALGTITLLESKDANTLPITSA
jgi:uncharacterized protein (TIGR00369 family)